VLILHWARVQRAIFGVDLVSTYGPWGFVIQGYRPETLHAVYISWMALTVALFAGLVRLSQMLPQRTWLRVGWMLLILLLASQPIQGLPDLRILLLAWVFLLIHFYVDDRPLAPVKIALVLAMAFASLMKFSLCFSPIALIILVAVQQVIRRKAPTYLLIYLAAILVGWLCAGQPLSALPTYFFRSLQISSSYVRAESVYAVAEERDVAIYLLIAGALLGLVIATHRRDIRQHALALLAVMAMLFLLFKIGYVRHDGHEVIAAVGLASLTLMYAVVLAKQLSTRTARSILAVLIGCAIGFAEVSERHWEDTDIPGYTGRALLHIPDQMDFLFTADATAEYKAMLAQSWSENHLPPLSGAVDAYSWTQDVIFANAMEYRPRPVPQSYLAYSAPLARLNADFLASTRAPDWVLFDVQAIDAHLPAMEDSLSWPELLARYAITGEKQGLLLLQRLPQPQPYSFQHIQTVDADFGSWIPVPDSTGPVWVKLAIKPTIGGKLMEALYKPRPIMMLARTRNGHEYQFRVLPDVVQDGFLLSPVILDRATFAQLASGNTPGDLAVTQFKLFVMNYGVWSGYGPRYQITFQRLNLAPRF
jgi:hypothetical protein